MPLERASLGGRFAIAAVPLARAADLLADRGILARLDDRAWILQKDLDALTLRANELVAEHLRAFPLDRGMPIATLRAKLARSAGTDAAERAIALAAKSGPGALVIEGDVARIQTTRIDAALANRLAAARRTVEDAGKHGTGAFAVGEATGAPPGEVRAILAHLVRDGAAMQAGDLWFSRSLVEELRALAEAHLRRASTLSVAEFKGISGLARKQAVLLLEHFDRVGITRREGDTRVLR
jgi:selenocysteine-specific elongation factor